MKRKILWVVSVIMVVIGISTSVVFAKTFVSNWEQSMLNSGYSQYDVNAIQTIRHFTGKDSLLIRVKYAKLEDWDKVIEAYGVRKTDFDSYMKSLEKYKESIKIPDKIYDEMKKTGMSEKECKELARKAFNEKIDIKTAWEAKSVGKTPNDIAKENRQKSQEKAQTVNDFTFGKISKEEYYKKMKQYDANMTEKEMEQIAEKDKQQWTEIMINTSGITQDEIDAAKKMGMKDVIEICKLKNAEKITEIKFDDMVKSYKKGTNVDDYIKKNISSQKIEKNRAKVRNNK